MTSLLQVPGSMSRDCRWGEKAKVTPRRSASLFVLAFPLFLTFLQIVSWPHVVRSKSPPMTEWLLSTLITHQCWVTGTVLHSGLLVCWGWCANRSCPLLHCSATYIVSKNSCQWVGTTPMCTTKTLPLSVWWLLVRQLSTMNQEADEGILPAS